MASAETVIAVQRLLSHTYTKLQASKPRPPLGAFDFFKVSLTRCAAGVRVCTDDINLPPKFALPFAWITAHCTSKAIQKAVGNALSPLTCWQVTLGAASQSGTATAFAKSAKPCTPVCREYGIVENPENAQTINNVSAQVAERNH